MGPARTAWTSCRRRWPRATGGCRHDAPRHPQHGSITVTWSAIVSKELASRLQGRLSYVVLTLMVVTFTGLVLGSFWAVVVSVPTVVPVIGSSAPGTNSISVSGLVGAYRGVFLFFAM